jgi:hypothetical protein
MIEMLQILGLVSAAFCVTVLFQAFRLIRILRSTGWVLLLTGFMVFGGLRIWQYIRLPSAMIRAIGAGAMPERLTLEQWVGIIASLGFFALIVAGLDFLRRDLEHIGVKP